MTLTCYIKKKRGLCKKAQLQELDLAIAEKKAFYQLLIQEIEKVEKLIKGNYYRKLWTVSMPLYDGFNCQKINIQERDDKMSCPYHEETTLCETLVDYKIEVLAYQKEKVRKTLQKYNELACLLYALQHYNQKKYCIKPYMLLSLNQSEGIQLGYYAVDELTCYEGKCEYLSIFYMSTLTQVMIETIPLIYRSQDYATSGTSLKTNHSTELWFEIEPRFLQLPISKTILKSVQEVICFLRRHGKKVAGSFISVKELDDKMRQEVQIAFKEIGYQMIGKVVQSQFIENQVLVWPYHTKK